MTWLQDEPIADPVCVPVYYVSKLARDHGVTVCQVGEGADELFWGYPAWKTMRRLAQLAAGLVLGVLGEQDAGDQHEGREDRAADHRGIGRQRLARGKGQAQEQP